jgi:adenine-specific DNA-methyltransferase
MEKIDNGHPLSQSTDFVAQNIETLKTLFPTIVKEGKIDIKELQALLGDDVETEEEYYRFTWAGKSMARREANKPSTATIRPDKESSKDWETTQNIFIEGDNLEVLKLLQKSYSGKIKLIEIDPPYNTGNDFVYKDKYDDNLSNYLEITNQKDGFGNRISSNAETDGRFHSNWLNMMYPRLKLARELLTADGAIFIHIDHNESSNLQKLCNEIFGEENFIAQVIWQRAFSPVNLKKHFSESHDIILGYARDMSKLETLGLKRSEDNLDRYKNPDNDPRGVWASGGIDVGPVIAEKVYPITTPSGRVVYPPNGYCWRYSQDKLEALIRDNRIWFGENGDNVPRIKRFLTEVKDRVTPMTLWLRDEVGDSQSASRELKSLFDDKSYFDYPKPINLIKKVLSLYLQPSDFVLDFFAGSGTIAHATFQLNNEDGGNRKFICVQLPEPTDEKSEAFKAGYKSISKITKERIRRAGDSIVKGKLLMVNEKKAALEKLENDGKLIKDEEAIGALREEINNLQISIKNLDIGFRAFKLDSSNIRAWDGNPDALEDNLFNAGSNIKKENRTEEDLLYEILLKYGLDLTMPIEQKAIADKQVFNIGMGALFICLGDNITTAVAEGIGKWKEELMPATAKVIFKDTGFTDVEKTNSMQILKRFGIIEVNTI